MRSKAAWRNWRRCAGKEATRDGRGRFSGGIDRLDGGGVGFGSESGPVALPATHGSDPAEILSHVGGSRTVAIDSGKRIFSDARDVVQRFEFRGRGDLRA